MLVCTYSCLNTSTILLQCSVKAFDIIIHFHFTKQLISFFTMVSYLSIFSTQAQALFRFLPPLSPSALVSFMLSMCIDSYKNAKRFYTILMLLCTFSWLN